MEPATSGKKEKVSRRVFVFPKFNNDINLVTKVSTFTTIKNCHQTSIQDKDRWAGIILTSISSYRILVSSHIKGLETSARGGKVSPSSSSESSTLTLA